MMNTHAQDARPQIIYIHGFLYARQASVRTDTDSYVFPFSSRAEISCKMFVLFLLHSSRPFHVLSNGALAFALVLALNLHF
jgi:hypothetical protein